MNERDKARESGMGTEGIGWEVKECDGIRNGMGNTAQWEVE
jgi:hypothetical protein